MTYVHVAHDCQIGDGVTIANATQLAGHVTIEDRATLSGLIAVHQFVTIGTHAFVGGASRVNQDIPPYVKAVGNPVELFGLNTVGLQRAGFSRETLAALKRAYRLLFNSDLTPRRGARASCAPRPPGVPGGRAAARLRRPRRGAGCRHEATRCRIGVIGVGALGWHHARHLAAMPEAELVGVYDIRPDRAAQVAAAARHPGLRRPATSCSRACEAVTVAVPTLGPRRGGAGGAGSAGVPVLMEKPLAATLEEADALVDRGARSGRAAAGGPHRALQPRLPRGRAVPRPTPSSSRANGWRRSSPAAPTCRSCST